jgi:hypothetical protein
MCRYYDFECPNYSEDEEVDGAAEPEVDDVLGDDNIDFVEEDTGQGGMPSCSVAPDTGAFGTTGSGGDKDYVETIVFQYQVQTVVNLTANDFAFDKLPLIELALSNLMVPDIFLGSLCGESGRRRRAMTEVRAGGHARLEASTTSFAKVRRAVPPLPLRRDLLELPIGASDLDGLDSKPNDLIAPGLDGGAFFVSRGVLAPCRVHAFPTHFCSHSLTANDSPLPNRLGAGGRAVFRRQRWADAPRVLRHHVGEADCARDCEAAHEQRRLELGRRPRRGRPVPYHRSPRRGRRRQPVPASPHLGGRYQRRER